MSSFIDALNSDPNLGEAESAALAKDFLKQSQVFLAYDAVKPALERFPASRPLKQILARILVKTRALEEARTLLEELDGKLGSDDQALTELCGALRKTLALVKTDDDDAVPDAHLLETLRHLLKGFGKAVGSQSDEAAADEETLGLLGSVYKRLWRRNADPLLARKSRDTYLRGYVATGGIWSGINAATMSWLIGDREKGRQLAEQVLANCHEMQDSIKEPYYHFATMGEAHLLLGNEAGAIEAYVTAMRAVGKSYDDIASSLEQLQLLKGKDFPVPDALFDVVKPPAVVVFVGHMIDRPERSEPRFPARLETRVRAEIEKQLDDIDAQIGYCSAACGADILFIEEMLDREAEVNILLPFAKSDFILTSVGYAGAKWITRFQRALQLAKSVTYITEEAYMGDEQLFDFLGRMFSGYAVQRARTLNTMPHLLAVLDRRSPKLTGGTSELVANWPYQDRMRIIPVDELLRDAGVGPNHPTPVPAARQRDGEKPPNSGRLIRTLMFADVVGYSKMQEENLPCFIRQFLQHIADRVEQPKYINTWGDAIFAVMDEAMSMIDYALKLRDVVCNTDWTQHGLLDKLNIRIALHAGPVFQNTDPITGKPNFYGSHVNRAARMEPVTVPGQIYASEQFVALLTAEQIAYEARGGPPSDIVCEYLGKLTLAKNFGSQVAYHIYRSAVTECPSVGE